MRMRTQARTAAVALTWLLPLAASAASVDDANGNLNQIGTMIWGTGAQKSLVAIIGNLIGVALGLLGIVLVVLIMYAGFLWMTANGNDEQVLKAKKMITNAVVGLVIIMSSYSIATFVIQAISTATTG